MPGAIIEDPSNNSIAKNVLVKFQQTTGTTDA